MSPRNIYRSLRDTPFSADRLVIWGLMINLLVLVSGIIVLAYQGKDIVPVGTLAGTIIGYFSGRNIGKVKE